MHLGLLDVFAMAFYAAILLGTAQFAAAKAGRKRGFRGVPRAGEKRIGWWAYGISLLVAAHSAEQILGMAGAAYAFGIAVATYEWTATITILLVGKYLLPVLHKNKLTSIPDFLHRRYGALTQFLVGSSYVLLIIFIKLPVILWLSATAVHCITGLGYFPSLLMIGLFAGNYALYVGLKQDAFGNLIHIILVLLSGVIVVGFTLTLVTDNGGWLAGLTTLTRELPEHFHMYLRPGDNGYIYAPGAGMLFGGMWVLHFAYWGANPGIFRRTAEDEDIRSARNSLLITAIIKLFFPVLVVLPGIIAFYLIPDLKAPDSAIPSLMLLLPPGVLGFVFSALMVAGVSAMGSELSALSYILSSDVLNNDFVRIDSRRRLIITRVLTKVILIVAILLTDIMLRDKELAFMYMQNMMGMLAPVVLTLFAMGIFWKGANQAGAICSIAGSLIFSGLMYVLMPEIPFIHRIGFAFLVAIALMIAGARLFRSFAPAVNITVNGIDFSTSRTFNVVGTLIVLSLMGIYALLW